MMTRLAILFFCCLLPASMLAQDTTGVHGAQPVVTQMILPTAQDLADSLILVSMGQRDPFVMLPVLVRFGDPLVPALTQLLWSDSLYRTTATDRQKHDVALFATMALKAIATGSARASLLTSAQTHRSIDVRGIALEANANAFYTPVLLQGTVPDKELIHVLLQNVDDTTNVPCLKTSLGQIAREGLIHWMGWDHGAPHGMTATMKTGPASSSLTRAQYRAQWWDSNANRIRWDESTAHFVLK